MRIRSKEAFTQLTFLNVNMGKALRYFFSQSTFIPQTHSKGVLPAKLIISPYNLQSFNGGKHKYCICILKLSKSVIKLAKCMFNQSPEASKTVPRSYATPFLPYNG